MSPAPVAAQIQGLSNEHDHQMTQLARAAQGRRLWWWGVRKWSQPVESERSSRWALPDGRGGWSVPCNGAWCYLCDRPIATWSSRWPVTEQARARIGLHRLSHIQERLDALATSEATR